MPRVAFRRVGVSGRFFFVTRRLFATAHNRPRAVYRLTACDCPPIDARALDAGKKPLETAPVAEKPQNDPARSRKALRYPL